MNKRINPAIREVIKSIAATPAAILITLDPADLVAVTAGAKYGFFPANICADRAWCHFLIQQ